MYVPLVLVVSCFASGVLSGILGPCKKQDNECLQKTFSKTFPLVIAGIPSLRVDTSDPLVENIIEGNLSILSFKLINSTVTGYKHCSLINSKFDIGALKLDLDLHCSNINMEGEYEISGKLLVVPVEGKGTYKIGTSEYLISINTNLKIIEDADGKSYVNIKNFETKPQVLGPITFQFNNLFNGRKDLSDAVHKFAHDSYREVAELVQIPIFRTCITSVIKNFNKFFKTQPLQEILIDFE